ncbi:MAG: peptidoglycan DD-metalloendopeptidase family protein [Candidatus Yonathbacteria bacterium]|nr:peptidoglycan DD-metalloendopeptidase family protein [Candidatus Yonathbacteria bacterium]
MRCKGRKNIELPFNFRLIHTHKQDPDSSVVIENQAKKDSFLWLSVKKSAFLFLSTILIMSPVSYANAGLFSFLGSIFGTSEAATSPQEPAQDYVNSQGGGLLQAAVNVNPKLPRGGGDITIVNDSALLSDIGLSGNAGNFEEFSSKGDQLSIYVVRKGDSLSQIAKMFGVSVNTIIWANGIQRGESIHEGETLVILPVSGIQHVVAKGETLKSIAQKYHGDENEIIAYNGLKTGEDLTIGSTVVIPDGMLSMPAVSPTQTRNRAHGTGGPSYTGYYLRPTDGVLSQGLHGYNGVDLAAPIGTPVFASASGDVVVSKYRDGNPWFGGYGNYIVISHDNGTQTLYGHLSKVIVGEGWRVVQGQVIGYVGNTGRSTGAHLHFEVRGARNPFQ